MVIKRLGVWSVARMYGFISAAIGLFIGLFLGLFSVVGAGLSPDPTTPRWFMPLFGAGAIVMLPIFYGLMGVVAGAAGAVVYNVFAGVVGGVSMEVE